jgi:spore maturation protein CgeB
VNLNVVRDEHANIFATSTSRPFELAAMRCCAVSAPYKGIEKWFEVGKEILVANSAKECLEMRP